MANVYNRGKFLCISVDMDALDVWGILLSTAFAFNVDHNVLSEISTSRLDTDLDLGVLTANEDDTNDISWLDCGDPTWSAVAGGSTVAGFAVYREVGAEASDELVCFIDTTDTATNGGDITINISATEGFLKLT